MRWLVRYWPPHRKRGSFRAHLPSVHRLQAIGRCSAAGGECRIMKHCMIVDDSRVIRRVASRILEDLSFETSEAESGQMALEACRHRMPDVILLDSNMPSMSYLEFLRTLRRQANGAHPVVVVWAYQRCLGCGRQRIHHEAVRSRKPAIETGGNRHGVRFGGPLHTGVDALR